MILCGIGCYGVLIVIDYIFMLFYIYFYSWYGIRDIFEMGIWIVVLLCCFKQNRCFGLKLMFQIYQFGCGRQFFGYLLLRYIEGDQFQKNFLMSMFILEIDCWVNFLWNRYIFIFSILSILIMYQLYIFFKINWV